MSPKQILEAALPETFGDERTGPYRLALAPGLSGEELELRELGLRAPPVPEEIRELLLFTEWFDLGGTEIAFWEFDRFGLESVFPSGNAIGDSGEGSGNFWVLDVNQRTGEWGPVFYACHDPPVIVLHSPTLADFLQDVLDEHRFRRESPLGKIASFVAETWRSDPGLRRADDLKSSPDPVLRRFAMSLPDWREGWLLADLRGRRVGDGFSWGRFGPETVIRRYGSELLFAVSPSPVRRRGVVHWLLGRS